MGPCRPIASLMTGYGAKRIGTHVQVRALRRKSWVEYGTAAELKILSLGVAGFVVFRFEE